MADASRTSVLPDWREAMAAGVVAAFASLAVTAGYSLVEWLWRSYQQVGHVVLSGVVPGIALGTLYVGMVVMPVAWAMTLGVGVPVVMLWHRWFGGISGPTTVALGVLIGPSPVLLIALIGRYAPSLPGLSLFAACGAATATAFWWIALRNPAVRPSSHTSQPGPS